MTSRLQRSQSILLGAVAIIAGLVTWLIVATVANVALRKFLPGYVEVEAAMTFTLPMLLARLVVGALASLGAGVVVALVTRRRRVALGLGIILVVFFLPAHFMLWARFPFWYHAIFFVSLLVLPPVAYLATIRSMGRESAPPPPPPSAAAG